MQSKGDCGYKRPVTWLIVYCKLVLNCLVFLKHELK